LIGGDAVLGCGVMGGASEIVGLTCGEAGDSGSGGVAHIEGLGISAAGGSVNDVVADDSGVSISVPGQGDALSSLRQGQRSNQERSDAEPESGTSQKRKCGKERFRSGRKHFLIITLIIVITIIMLIMKKIAALRL
jgi:hypothetical protein